MLKFNHPFCVLIQMSICKGIFMQEHVFETTAVAIVTKSINVNEPSSFVLRLLASSALVCLIFIGVAR